MNALDELMGPEQPGPTPDEIRRVFKWLSLQCCDLDSPLMEAGARSICARHQNEIRGLEGSALDDRVESLWRSYCSEAKAAIWAIIKTAPIEGLGKTD